MCRPQKEPWYEPERTGFRRLIESVKVNLGLNDSSTIPGPKYKSEGFRLEECVSLITFILVLQAGTPSFYFKIFHPGR